MLLCLDMLQISVSELLSLRGSLHAEWAVLPHFSRVTAMPEEATAIAIFLSLLILESSRLIKKGFTVRLGVSRNKTQPLPESTLAVT